MVRVVETLTCLAGLLTVAWVLVYGMAMTFEAVRRAGFASARRAREIEVLEARVQAARKRRALAEQLPVAWNGWRKFVLIKKVTESPDVVSFYLAPHDKKPLPHFKAGQFISFRVQIPGEPRPTTRCYSLSEAPHPEYFRVSIKREARGLVSRHFHDQLRIGDIVDVNAPNGHFCLDPESSRPVVLVGGGIGAAPMVGMVNGLLRDGRITREVHYFAAMRNSLEHPFKDHFEQLAQAHEKLHNHVVYSKPFAHDVRGRDYHFAGHLSVELMKLVLPSNNYVFYFCGPSKMAEGLVKDLQEWGVPESDIHYEAFTPATRSAVASGAGKTGAPAAAGGAGGAGGGAAAPAEAGGISVKFNRSGRTAVWKPSDGTLLDLADKNEVRIDGGCRTGNCGTCLVAIQGGTVTYQTKPGVKPEDGTCLTCCSVPASDLVLDA